MSTQPTPRTATPTRTTLAAPEPPRRTPDGNLEWGTNLPTRTANPRRTTI